MGQEDPNGKVVYIPVPKELQEEVQRLVQMATETPGLKDGNGFADDERDVYRHTDRLGDLIIVSRLQAAEGLHKTREAARRLLKSSRGRIKDQGLRDVKIMTMRGGEITIRTPYFSRNCDAHKSRGSYPVLALLGVHADGLLIGACLPSDCLAARGDAQV